jgi:hypothetical protein
MNTPLRRSRSFVNVAVLRYLRRHVTRQPLPDSSVIITSVAP